MTTTRKKATATRGGSRRETAAPRFQNMRFDPSIIDLIREDLRAATEHVEQPLSVRAFIAENFDTLYEMRRGRHKWNQIYEVLNRHSEARGKFTIRTVQAYFNAIADERGVTLTEELGERRGPKRRKRRKR